MIQRAILMRTDAIDVSLPIRDGMLAWPGDPAIVVERTAMMERGDVCNVSRLSLGTHTGTHVDAPLHFIPGGSGVDAIGLDILCGECIVVDARGYTGALGRDVLERIVPASAPTRVLIRSDNSALWSRPDQTFPAGYVCLAPDGAQWLIDRGVQLIGIDFLSIEAADADGPDGKGHPVHRSLLGAGVVILEGLDLSHADPGSYRLTCLPLRVENGDGSPARAVLHPA